MTKPQKNAVFLLRIALGFLYLYAGIAKLIDPAWTSSGYLRGAQTFDGFYQWLATPQNIVYIDFLNEWGLFLIGSALILGLAVRSASFFGILLMTLYYIPTLNFPYAGAHAYIVDEHVVYIAVLLALIVFNAGGHWGIDGILERSHSIPARLKKCVWCK